MIDNHKVELDKTKEEYSKLTKALDELRASEVRNLHPVWCYDLNYFCWTVSFHNLISFAIKQVDAEYKLQDTKKLAKEWEMKVKAFRKRLDEIQTNLAKHMDQYV